MANDEIKEHPRVTSRNVSSVCRCSSETKSTVKTVRDEIHHVYPHMPRNFLQGAGHLSSGNKKKSFDTFSYVQKGSGTISQKL